MPFNLFFIYKCFLCHGMGRLAIVNKKKKDKMPESKECPMCLGKGFQKVRKSYYDLGDEYGYR